MDDPNHSPAYKIYHYKFDYSIPAIHFYTQEYLDFVGILSSGDKKTDRQLMNEQVHTRGTIREIAEKWGDDINVILVNPRDSVRIYEALNAHLHDWNSAVKEDINLQMEDVPLDKLALYDAFAGSIYEMARRFKPEIKERITANSRLRKMGGGFERSGYKRLAKISRPLEIEEHHPVLEVMEREIARRRGED